jgi:hypothetical protein
MAAGETPGPSGARPDRYFEDISADELSANAPVDETNDDKNARRERNRKCNERRRCLRESLPVRNLAEALDQVANRVHTTPEQCLMSISTIARQAQGIRAGEVIAKLVEDAYFMRVDNRVTQAPPPELANMRTMKPQVAVQLMDASVPEENSPRTPTVLGRQLEDLLRVVAVLAAPVAVTTQLIIVMLAAEVAATGAPHTELEGESVAEAIAEAEATQIATSPAPHAAATMPAAELKKYDATSPPRQATTMASPPSLLDFATYFSQRNSNLWGSLSTTRSKTQSNGSDATPSPSKTLVATMIPSASTFPSAWTKHHSHGSSRSTSTRSISGTSSRISSPATSRAPWDARVLAWTWQW